MFLKLKKMFGRKRGSYSRLLVMTPYLSNELNNQTRTESGHEGVVSLTYLYDDTALPDVKKALILSVKDMMDIAYRWNEMVEENSTEFKGRMTFSTLSISRAYLSDTSEAIRGMSRMRVDDLTNRYVNSVKNAESLNELLELPPPIPSLRKRRLFCMLKPLD